MRPRGDVLIRVLSLLIGWVLPWPAAFAQTPPPASLEQQLRTDYKLVKTASDAGGLSVVQPGTVLVVQKGGILGVVHTNVIMCSAKYQDGSLKAPGGFCAAMIKDKSRFLNVGEKVYPSRIDFNVAKERISLQIVECDSCNGVSEPSFLKSQVDFQFGKGYLEKASIGEIEDTISQVLPFEAGGEEQAPQAQGQPAAPGQPGDAPPAQPCTVEVGQIPEQVVGCLGQPEKIIKVAPKQIYVYKDFKVTFLNGKVSDVQ